MIFDENAYEQFVEIELTQENLSFYEESYFSNNIEFTTPEWEFKFFYSLAKHFIDYYKQNATPIKNVLFVSKDEYYKPIYYSLKAIDVLSNRKVGFQLNDYIKRAYVKLGNYYANQYRNYEAIDCYNQALYYAPNFDMAIANRILAFEKIECLHYYIDSQQLLKYLTNTYNSIQPRKMEAGRYLFELKSATTTILLGKLKNI